MSIFVSDSPYGPWTQQMPWVVAGSGAQEINGAHWAKGMRYIGGNPTALILENGTTLVFFRGGGGNWSQCAKLGVSVKSLSADCTGPNDPNCPKDKVNGCALPPPAPSRALVSSSPPCVCASACRPRVHSRGPRSCGPLVWSLLYRGRSCDPFPARRFLHVQDETRLPCCFSRHGPLADARAHRPPRLLW